MNKRHEDQLWARLDQLYANGTTFITLGEMYHWYNADRIAKTPWRDIKRRWEELLEEKGQKSSFYPKVADLRGGYAFFYATDPKDLREWAE
jgi:predicted P-loop ATPase